MLLICLGVNKKTFYTQDHEIVSKTLSKLNKIFDFTCYLTGDNQYSSQFPGEKIFYNNTVKSKEDFVLKYPNGKHMFHVIQ